jgi:hypothetical protein
MTTLAIMISIITCSFGLGWLGKAYLVRRLKRQMIDVFEEIQKSTLESSEEGKRLSNAEAKVVLYRISKAVATALIILKQREKTK